MSNDRNLFAIDCAKTGMNIYNKRKALRMSAVQIADKLGISRIAVHKWEAGYNFPDLNHIYVMAKIFGCKIDDIVVGK